MVRRSTFRPLTYCAVAVAVGACQTQPAQQGAAPTTRVVQNRTTTSIGQPPEGAAAAEAARVYKGTGALLPAWTNVRYSYAAAASESSPIVADIDGDGQNEVIVGGEDANVYAFDNDGTMMAGFPIHLNGEIRGTPLVWDIDHDDKTELIVAGWDKNLYVWDLEGAFNPNGISHWSMWRHDNTHQGRADALACIHHWRGRWAGLTSPGRRPRRRAA